MCTKAAYLAHKARRAARVGRRGHEVGKVVGKVKLVDRVVIGRQVLLNGGQLLVAAAAVGVARAAFGLELLARLEEAFCGARVHRGLEDVDEEVEGYGDGGEDEEVAAGVGALEALLFDTVKLRLPAVGLEQVEHAHEQVDGGEDDRDQELGDVNDQELDSDVDELRARHWAR